MKGLREYFEQGWTVVVKNYMGGDEYSLTLGDDFEDLPVESFDDCESFEIVESEHQVYVTEGMGYDE